MNKDSHFAPVAQLVEQLTLNQRVQGSIPCWGTINKQHNFLEYHMIREKVKKTQEQIDAENQQRWKKARKMVKSLAKQAGIKVKQPIHRPADDYHNIDY